MADRVNRRSLFRKLGAAAAVVAGVTLAQGRARPGALVEGRRRDTPVRESREYVAQVGGPHSLWATFATTGAPESRAGLQINDGSTEHVTVIHSPMEGFVSTGAVTAIVTLKSGDRVSLVGTEISQGFLLGTTVSSALTVTSNTLVANLDAATLSGDGQFLQMVDGRYQWVDTDTMRLTDA